MPAVLRWGGDDGVLVQAHDSFVGLLSERLGNALARVAAHDPGLSQELHEVFGGLPDASVLRFVTAPEASSRLLVRHETADGLAGFLARSLRAEKARLGSPVRVEEEVWTALGDARFSPDGKRFDAPLVPGLMPLDFESPYGLSVDLGGDEPSEVVRTPLLPDEQTVVLSRLAAARDGIARASSHVLDFVAGFTKVLVLLPDPTAAEAFTSASSGQYVGRSALANPHLDGVDEVFIAEGLVHEAIHSLLYMQEQLDPWVYDNDLYVPVPRARSLWSGAPLALRPYLQACFVWYGLLHFWCLALASGAFPPERVRERIAQALSGFLAGPLSAQVTPYRDAVSPTLLAAIDELEEHVVSSFDASTASAG